MPKLARPTIVLIVAVTLAASTLTVAHADESPIQPGEELTLAKAVELAIRYHPAALAAQSESLAAAERIGEARGAMLPQVFGVGNYLRATDNGIGTTTLFGLGYVPRISGSGRNNSGADGLSFSTENNYLGGVAASQYLFDFGRVRGLIDQRKAEAAAQRAKLGLTDLDLTFQVTQRYFALLAAKQLVRVYEKAVAQRGEHLHESQVKAQADLKPQIDVYTSQAELARAKLALVNAQNSVDDDKVALDNAMGLGDGAPDYHLADVLTYGKIDHALSDYLQTAFEHRPDLAELNDDARAAGAQITQYRSDYFPTTYAIANYSTMGTTTPAATNFDAGVVITWPIFNGMETSHQVAEAKYHQRAIEHTIKDLRQRVFLEVKSAYLDWLASLERIRRAEQTLAASAVELELAEKRYEAGLGDIIELTDAQQRYTDDDAQYVQALYSFSLSKAALERATGGSLSVVQ